MSDIRPLPNPNIPFLTAAGLVTKEWYAWLSDVNRQLNAQLTWRAGLEDNLFFSTLIDDGILTLADGVTAPAAAPGFAKTYVDTADGDLKEKFGDGFVRVIGADS